MVQTLQSKAVTLHELHNLFGLQLVEDQQFFQEWQDSLPELTEEEKRRLDRVKTSFTNILEYPPLLENTVKMVVLSPLLDLADFYLRPLHIKSEPSFQITTEDEATVIKGNLDVLVLFEQLWVLAIEAKRSAVDVDEGRAQLLSYMLASPMQERPVFGMITNGRNFLFLKLITQPVPRYAMSRLFSLVNPGNELYAVLGILKRLVKLVQRCHG